MHIKTKLTDFVRGSLNEKANFNRKKLRTINENILNNKTIINVDIQPEYEDYFTFDVHDWVKFINDSSDSNDIVFLYNGKETLGMIDLSDYQIWLMELGISEDIIERCVFYDKGYNYFRYCMDSSIDEQNIADLVKFMVKHDINDSRMIDEDMWDMYMEETNHTRQDVRDLLEDAHDLISIPELMDFIKNYDNIVLTGGGITECLKEVEIALLALDMKYEILNEFTY